MKIAVCTPHYRDLNANFVLSTMAMIAFTSKAEIIFNGERAWPAIEWFTSSGSVLSDLRNELVHKAIGWEANYLLWLDSDHTFPPDTLIRLLSHNLMIVGANYPRRTVPTYPTAAALDGSHLWTSQELASQRTVERVSRLGLGVCLMNMAMLQPVQDFARLQGRRTIWPLFSQEPTPNSLWVKGEDTFFFDILAGAGIEAHVDHGLSWEVGHVHEIILTNADAMAQKEAFLASRSSPP